MTTKPRATRITREFAEIMVILVSRTSRDEWTTAAELDRFSGETVTRVTVNNVIRAASEHGLLLRSDHRPYGYKISPDLSEENRAFLNRVQREWLGDAISFTEFADHRVTIPFTAQNFSPAKVVMRAGEYHVSFAISPLITEWLAENVREGWSIIGDGMAVAVDFEDGAEGALFKLAFG